MRLSQLKLFEFLQNGMNFKGYNWKKFIQTSKINVHLFDSRNIVDKSLLKTYIL